MEYFPGYTSNSNGEISKREFLLFIAITLALLGISIALTFTFSAKAETENAKYDRAITLEDSTQITHAYNTAAGYCFSTSKITPYENDVITDEHNTGNFIYLQMKAYKYEEETYTETDDEGNTVTKTRWDWNYKPSESWTHYVSKVVYDDDIVISHYDFSKFAKRINTRKEYHFFGSDWKYEYYAVYFDETVYTMFANFSDQQTLTEVQLMDTSNIEEAKTRFKTQGWAFGIVAVWGVFIALETLVILIFYKYDNDWLED